MVNSSLKPEETMSVGDSTSIFDEQIENYTGHISDVRDIVDLDLWKMCEQAIKILNTELEWDGWISSMNKRKIGDTLGYIRKEDLLDVNTDAEIVILAIQLAQDKVSEDTLERIKFIIELFQKSIIH